MDILLVDPPYTSLKGIATKRGYHVGLTSLAAYLRRGDIESGVMMGDLLSGLISYDSAVRTNIKAYAAGQRDYETIINDRNHIIWEKIGNVIKQTEPKIVGISYITPLKCVVERIASLVKDLDRDIKVVAGSFHPTFCPEEVMRNPNIDFVVTGEGEIPLLSLINELKNDSPHLENVPGIYYKTEDGQIKSNARTNPVADLDELPFLARDLVLNCDYGTYRIHSIYTSRGCPYTCAFCSDRGFWGGKVRRRSVSNVIEELKLIKNTYHKIDYIDIVDGTFTFDRKYLNAFCNAMINEEIDLKWRCTARYDNLDTGILKLMKQAGCSGLYLGAETGSNRLLKSVDKKITTRDILRVSQMVYESGILSATAILLGLPDENKKDAEETLNLMRKVKTDILDVNSYVPLPGTELFALTGEEDKRNIDWLKVGYKSYDNYFSKKMSRSEFNKYRAEAYKIANSLQRKTIVRLGLKMLFGFLVGLAKNLKPRSRQMASNTACSKHPAQ
jgi:anaerobic magnesium-protoporphyrin IX monomethyl ester cyclase